jgi:hypothetical protein
MKRRRDRQHGRFGADPFGQRDAVLDCSSGEFGPVCWYQDVVIHRPLRDRAKHFWELYPIRTRRAEMIYCARTKVAIFR